ncbi:MAG: hypothetical protein K2R93_12325 [Gemmatimonadaceae bacterium]|nr:hypothetical protein [Gemmatimonadaceae bacterium]
MSLKMFDTKDAIPEALRESAIETKDGKWAVSDTEGLRSSQQRILDEKKRLQDEFEQMKQSLGGLSPEQIKKFREDMTRLEDEQARKAGDFDKILEKRIGETKAEYEKRLAELAPYKQKYQDRELEIAIRDAASKAGVIATDLPFVLDIVKGRRVAYDEKTGKPVVLDKDGDPTGLTVEKFFADTFKTEAPKFYEPAGGSGGGAGGGNSGGKPTGTAGAVSITDNAGFIANLDKIAAGQVKVAS